VATTALFVEILIIGLETAVWLCLLILTYVGPVNLDPRALKDWSTLLTALALAAAYVLGILVDRASDSFYLWFETTRAGKVANRYMGESSHGYKTPAGVAQMRLTVMKESEGIARFLDYQRSRARIARATVLNVALAVPIAALYLSVQVRTQAGPVLVVVAFGIALLLLSLFASERIHAAYVKRLSDAYTILTQGVPTKHER
jgi:hypothetical protein